VNTPPPATPPVESPEIVTNALQSPEQNLTPPPAPTPAPQMTVSPQLAAPEVVTNGLYVPSSNNEQYPVNPPMTSGQTNMAPITVPPVETQSPVTPPPVATTPPPSTSATMKPTLPPPPAPSEPAMTAPPLPISAEKQGQLQDLLSRYMADQITPTQYQEERAKIMAQPN
jgi:hypothetical protein